MNAIISMLRLEFAPPAATLLPRDAGGLWIRMLGVVLIGYAVANKGFAYIGVPPLFIGEITLLAGVAAFLTCPAWRRVFDIHTIWLFLMLAAWGLLQTLPYLGQYKADALRDAVIWAYGAYMVLVTGWVIARPELVGWLLRKYQRFAPPFLLCMPGLWILQQLAGEYMFPYWPWADVEMIHLKGADLLVHLAGISALAVAGLFPSQWIGWPAMLLLNVALAGVVNRGGMVSFAVATCVAMCFAPRSTWFRHMVIIGIIGVVVMIVVEPRIEGGSKRREISFEQLSNNVMSLVGDVKTGDLDDTKTWRIEWWTKIINYTVHGKYFWTGKGYGINLADSDGFQVNLDGSLRSPHNGHMTMLARGGVPGAVLWAAVQLSYALTILGAILRSRAAGQRQWTALFIVLLAYWVAFMLNASFDVFIEGPMGGIWLWSLMGIGLGAAYVHRHCPELAGMEDQERQSTCA